MDKNKLHSVFHLESCICLDYSIRYFSVSYYFHLWLSFTIDYVDNIHGFIYSFSVIIRMSLQLSCLLTSYFIVTFHNFKLISYNCCVQIFYQICCHYDGCYFIYVTFVAVLIWKATIIYAHFTFCFNNKALILKHKSVHCVATLGQAGFNPHPLKCAPGNPSSGDNTVTVDRNSNLSQQWWQYCWQDCSSR